MSQSVMGNSFRMPTATMDLGENRGVCSAKNQLFELQITQPRLLLASMTHFMFFSVLLFSQELFAQLPCINLPAESVVGITAGSVFLLVW